MDKKIEKIDIKVIQKPVNVEFECPHCEGEIEFEYTEFCGIAGEVCDWTYTKMYCPKCGKACEIDNVDWD